MLQPVGITLHVQLAKLVIRRVFKGQLILLVFNILDAERC